MTFWPTPHFRYVRRDSAAPSLVLQQWWFQEFRPAVGLLPPETPCHHGVWRDVPIAELREMANQPFINPNEKGKP